MARDAQPRRALAALALTLAILACGPAPVPAKLHRLRGFGKTCFPTTPCTMLLNREKAVGCGQCLAHTVSEPVLELTQRQDLLEFLDSRIAGPRPRALLVPEQLFYDPEFLNKLPYTSNVASVVVYEGFGNELNNTATMAELSSDAVVPNQRFLVPSSNYSYNNRSQTSAQSDLFYPFNIFHVTASVAAKIRAGALAESHPSNPSSTNSVPDISQLALSGLLSRQYRLESSGQMFACPSDAAAQREASAKTTPQVKQPGGFVTLNSSACLHRGTCRPVGGQSIWSSLGVLGAPSKPEIIAITAPFDSMAFFHGLASGAAAEVASLATMMAVAEAVGKYSRSPAGRSRPMVRQPVYFAWAAQSWGFAGSSRFLEDVMNFRCILSGSVKKAEMGCLEPYMPSIKFKDFKKANFTVINLAGLVDPLSKVHAKNASNTKPSSSSSFFVHGQEPTSKTSPLRDALKAAFANNAIEPGLTLVPPDASQSFAQYRPDVESLSIASYRAAFSNQYYHSQFDTPDLIPPQVRYPLSDAAAGVARAVIKLAFNDDSPSVDINRTTIDGFIACMTSNWTNARCDLSKEYQGNVVYNQAVGYVASTNYAGVSFPYSRTSEITPSTYVKADLINNFLAYHNRHSDSHKCETVANCQSFANSLNANATSQSDLRHVFCSRGVCVAADTYPHDAFGTAIDAVNSDRSAFKVNENASNSRSPERPQWTESNWDVLELCGKTVDSSTFGGLILGVGLAVNLVSLFVAGLVHYFYLSTKKADNENERGDAGPAGV
jgi:Nicastrin small lobe/Nicastrin